MKEVHFKKSKLQEKILIYSNYLNLNLILGKSGGKKLVESTCVISFNVCVLILRQQLNQSKK